MIPSFNLSSGSYWLVDWFIFYILELFFIWTSIILFFLAEVWSFGFMLFGLIVLMIGVFSMFFRYGSFINSNTFGRLLSFIYSKLFISCLSSGFMSFLNLCSGIGLQIAFFRSAPDTQWQKGVSPCKSS